MCGHFHFSAEEAAKIKYMVKKINRQLHYPLIKTGGIYPTNLAPVLLANEENITAQPMLWGSPHWRNSEGPLLFMHFY